MSILCSKHSIGSPSHSETKPKFLQCPMRPPLRLVPCYLCEFISYYFSFTQFKPHCPPYPSGNTPNMYLSHDLRFHFPGTFFCQIFSWFYSSYLQNILIDSVFGRTYARDALNYLYYLNHRVFF